MSGYSLRLTSFPAINQEDHNSYSTSNEVSSRSTASLQQHLSLRNISAKSTELFWVGDGCASAGTPHDGSFQYKSYEAGVRCCSNDGTTCSTPLSCDDNKMPYGDAVSKCTEDHRRLCSKDELLRDICCGTGGNCDAYEIWTSTFNSG